ncbi:FCD domain-containing protein [Leucobacter sp. UT-8R-CII-1-4]|uniref:FadR/GntR family transcriptional regulator n=1 Tax=Leucobacter sp. UT-8R-CII-1-4 TaxID=3040075 RepID=UPI0024A9962C|nr:FCD domain-containing protein [Leucobacter sp. UT-8R-CII-1-4]MDI6022393.1 FCD domain-containing protein [Leucobacter sp. UT-8R-CII-1-4]
MGEPTKAWRVVVDRLQHDLVTGKLGPGDHILPERALAAELGVSRSAIREGLRVLEFLGLLRTGTGSGPNAGAIITSRPSVAMAAMMRLQVAAQGFRASETVSVRVMLEQAVVTQLAADPSPDLSRPVELLEAMEFAGLSPQEFLVLDAQFHLALAQASGNEVLLAIMTGLRESIEWYFLEAARTFPKWDEMVVRVRAEHREIINAIVDGDAERAKLAVAQNIEQLLPFLAD